MAFRAIQTAIVIDTLIADLVQEVIERCLSTKEPNPFKLGPCQRLFDILGIIPYGQQDDEILAVDDVELDKMMALKDIDSSPPTDPPCGKQTNEKIHKWHSWLVQALAAALKMNWKFIVNQDRQSKSLVIAPVKRNNCVSGSVIRALKRPEIVRYGARRPVS
ncbi:uncharacterized protein [Drosophila virilis]|uniref:uncharacterized protein isoform X2 n=1 Tax=Drosophila virilis TaxID=7244 RepID=UPI00139604E1|nr:uncharacterized protein LOC6628808 isoform X2 [Drosophila virilis]